MPVGEPFEQARFFVARWRPDGRRQDAQVRLSDLQRNVTGCSYTQWRRPSGVIIACRQMEGQCGRFGQFWMDRRMTVRSVTGDPGGEGAAGDVVLVEADYDAVVAGRRWQVGHCTGAVLVVLTSDLCLRRPLHGQGQPPCSKPSPHT